MALTVTIGGVDRTAWYKRGSLRMAWTNLYQSTAELTLIDRTASWAPTIDSTIVISESGTSILTGFISNLRRKRRGLTSGYRMDVSCVNNTSLMSQRVVRNFSVTEGQNTKTILSSLVSTYLGVFSVTFDSGGISNGATHHATVYDARYLSDVIAELVKAEGWVAYIDDSLVFKAHAPGTLSAPANFDASDTQLLTAEWEQTRDNYANYVTIQIGSAGGSATKWDKFDGDGSTRRCYLRTYPPYGIPACVVIYRSGVEEYHPVGWYGYDSTEWGYCYPTNPYKPGDWPANAYGLIQTGGTVVAAGDYYLVQYTVVFPVAITSPASMPGDPHEYFTAMPDCTDGPQAQAVADALYNKLSLMPKQVTAQTTRHGYKPGQSLTINLSPIGISSATYYIQEVRASDRAVKRSSSSKYLIYTVTCTEQGNVVDPWRDYYDSVSGATASGSVSVSVSSSPPNLHAHLGGSRTQDYAIASYVPVPEYQVFQCPASGNYTLRVDRKTLNAATSVTVRLYDLTTPGVVATGAASTSTSWSEETLTVALVSGRKYRAEVTGSDANYGVLVGQATLELTT